MTAATKPAVRRVESSAPLTHPRTVETLLRQLSALCLAVRPHSGASRRIAGLWAAARTPVLSVAGFACVTVAAFCVATALGWLVAGASLLIIESLSNTKGSAP